MTKKVIIYARVSTKDQDPDLQIRQLKQFAKDRNFKIVKTFEEKLSGAKDKRPLYQEMLDDVRKKKAAAVLVWKLDRFARSTRELLERLEEFHALGVELLSYTENIDTTTPIGKAFFQIAAVISEFERDLIRERIIAGVENAKAKGKRLGRPAISEETVNEIKRLKEKGLSNKEIMRKTGLTKMTVLKYLRT